MGLSDASSSAISPCPARPPRGPWAIGLADPRRLAPGARGFPLTAESGSPSEGAGGVAAAFPEWRCLRLVRRGGAGVVYEAVERATGRRLAVKVLGNGPVSATMAARFEREIRAVQTLEHPGIVRALGAGCRRGIWYLAMEFLEGVDAGVAAEAQPRGQMEAASACELIRQAAQALAHAHERGLVHRDVKPGNLMLAVSAGAAPAVQVLDFGLASFAHSEGTGGELTLTGEFLGTVDYVAPEQIEDPRTVGPRTDIYGLGATLYRLLAGAPPHAGGGGGATTLYSKLVRIARDPAPPLAAQRAGLPRGLAEVVDRMVAQNPAARFASAFGVADALAPFARGGRLAPLLGGAIPRPA